MEEKSGEWREEGERRGRKQRRRAVERKSKGWIAASSQPLCGLGHLSPKRRSSLLSSVRGWMADFQDPFQLYISGIPSASSHQRVTRWDAFKVRMKGVSVSKENGQGRGGV